MPAGRHWSGRLLRFTVARILTAPFLSVIIPAHNEESRLPRTLEQVFAFLGAQKYSSEVLVVENGSDDHTFDIAQGFADRHQNLRVIRETNRGKGLAVRRGMLEAAGQFRFMCDADLSMSIDQVNTFLPPALRDVDIAIGSREAAGAVRYDEPSFRHIGGRAINTVIRLLILPGLQDTQCGFKCFSAAAAQQVFTHQTLAGWSFDIEILYIARRRKLRVREVPIHWRFDAHTKLSAVQDALRMLRDILIIRRNAQRGLYDSPA